MNQVWSLVARMPTCGGFRNHPKWMPRSPTFMSSEIEGASVAKPPSPCSLKSLATSMVSNLRQFLRHLFQMHHCSAAIALAQSTRICGTASATGLGQLSSFINTSSNVTPLQASSCNHALNNHVASNHRMTSCWSMGCRHVNHVVAHIVDDVSTTPLFPDPDFLSIKPVPSFDAKATLLVKASGRLSSSIVR